MTSVIYRYFDELIGAEPAGRLSLSMNRDGTGISGPLDEISTSTLDSGTAPKDAVNQSGTI